MLQEVGIFFQRLISLKVINVMTVCARARARRHLVDFDGRFQTRGRIEEGDSRPQETRYYSILCKKNAHLKVDLAVVIDPSDDHVGPAVAVVLRETEPDITEGLHLDLERNVPLAGRPQHQEIIVEDGAVLPLDGNDAADEEGE